MMFQKHSRLLEKQSVVVRPLLDEVETQDVLVNLSVRSSIEEIPPY